MKKDIRNPSILGEKLLLDAKTVRNHYGKDISLAEVWDIHVWLVNYCTMIYFFNSSED